MLNLIMNRRTERTYLDKKVEKEKIDAICQAALSSPSGGNRKPIDLVVVEDKENLERLADSRGRVSQWIKNAPLGFVIVADPEKSTTWVSDGAIMATIIQLLGEDLGLKSCWIHAENRISDDGKSQVEDNIKEILDIPDNKRVLCMISMGYVKDKKPGYTRDDLDFSRIHKEKY